MRYLTDFGQFMFKAVFSCVVSAFLSYCHRAALPMATERPFHIRFFWLVNIFIGMGFLGNLKLF